MKRLLIQLLPVVIGWVIQWWNKPKTISQERATTQMQYYIGVKQIQAEPQDRDGKPGYRVVYPDGYSSWSPKKVFESAYLPMGEGSDGTKISQEMVDGFIHNVAGSKMGNKTTVVCVTMKNGFEVVESSSCVDPQNYSQEMGESIVVSRVKDRIWMLLGFLLQTARNGIRR